ncbi:MAG: hypothetical protein OQK44_03330 [Gammaproteobacteria bacterium]|nr:hypothetical protein [Gammaproteobacteria bacterium]
MSWNFSCGSKNRIGLTEGWSTRVMLAWRQMLVFTLCDGPHATIPVDPEPDLAAFSDRVS